MATTDDRMQYIAFAILGFEGFTLPLDVGTAVI